jgi:hypothetical protein
MKNKLFGIGILIAFGMMSELSCGHRHYRDHHHGHREYYEYHHPRRYYWFRRW